MPNIQSAKKRVKVASKKHMTNKMLKSSMRTTLKKFETVYAEGAKDKATEALSDAIRVVDKAVSKGVLHKNTAARKKSSLVLRYNKMA